MISDEQRREAAASLRGSRGFFNSLPRTVLEPFIFDIFERVLECVGYTEGNVFDYLADLVDRGECENVYDGSVQDSCDNGFLCSVCGCKVEDEEHYHVSGVWNFCPQCGRTVVKP